MSPVVLVSRDSRDETEVRFYLDEVEAGENRPCATVRRRELWLDMDLADEWIVDIVTGLARNELRSDRKADLSWMATHRIVKGALEPVFGRVA